MHAMFYSSEPEAVRAFLRDKLGFTSFTDVGGGWLIFDLPQADMGVHPTDPTRAGGEPAGTHDISFYCESRRGLRRRSGRCRLRPRHPTHDARAGVRVQLYQPHYEKNTG